MYAQKKFNPEIQQVSGRVCPAVTPLTGGTERHTPETASPDEPDSSVGRAEGGVVYETMRKNFESRFYPVTGEVENGDAFAERGRGNSRTGPGKAPVVRSAQRSTKGFAIGTGPGANGLAALREAAHSVASGGRTLWLPTVVATGTTTDTRREGGEATPPTLSQIFLTGAGRRLPSHAADGSPAAKSCRVSSGKFPPKVQILGSITISKPSGPRPNTVEARTPMTRVEGADASNGQRVAFTPGLPVQPFVPARRFATLEEPIGRPGRVLSRVLPSSKIPSTLANRATKGASPSRGRRPSGGAELAPVANVVRSHSVQSGKPAQQQTPALRAGFESGARGTIGAPKGPTCPSVVSPPGKNWTRPPASGISQVVDRKNAPYVKGIGGVVDAQKSNKGLSQKMLVRQPSHRIIVPSSAQSNRTNPQLCRPNDSGGAVRYVQNYAGLENDSTSSVSSNQNLTAQILQSLSQPKSLIPSIQPSSTLSKRPTPYRQFADDAYSARKSNDQRRPIHGDPNTAVISDDIPGGTEERPTLSDESLPYHNHRLQLVMLDHTYAQSTQVVLSNSVNGSNTVSSNTSPVNSNIIMSTPLSPTKIVSLSSNSPANGTLSGQLPISSMSVILPNTTNSTQNSSSYQYNAMAVEDDDAASVISSIEGDRDTERNDERHNSDTETAPEGEEEGKTRCVCEFTHDDGYMICCDRCGEWQHVDCMGIDRQNIPDDYMCDKCEPRLIDRKRARSIQIRKRDELTGVGSSGSDSSSSTSISHLRNRQIPVGTSSNMGRKRPLTVTTYSNTISGVSRTVPTLPAPFSPPYNFGNTSQLQSKRGPKRSRRIDNGRKGPKRKLPEKRKRKNSDVSNYRTKYCSLSTSTHQVNQWTESYEFAMTNHYSPELRAKVARYCSSKGGNNSSNMSAVLTAHLCTTVPHAGSKILIATRDMKENTPIIELRGKYMLSTQHKPQPQVTGRVGSQRPGPFLFFYRLPKDSTQICIDTRTYGNEARFVRRSCKPNAELQHCIIKGALHVYLVTVTSIQSNTEISIKHDSSGSLQPCACGNPKHCKHGGASTPLLHRNNGANLDAVGDRRGRTRLSSSSISLNHVSSNLLVNYDDNPKLESVESESKINNETELEVIKQEVPENDFVKIEEILKPEKFEELPPIEKKIIIEEEVKVKEEEMETTPIKNIVEAIEEETETKSIVKDEPVVDVPQIKPAEIESNIDSKDEEDNEPLSKFECKSPNQNALKNVVTTTVKTKDVEKSRKAIGTRRTSLHSMRTTRASASTALTTSESADEKSDTPSDTKSHQTPKDKKKMTREERKMEAIMKAFERMEKAELKKQENKDRQSRRRESDSNQPCSVTSSNESKEQQIDEPIDDTAEQSNIKRRRRKKGRTRTASQNNLQRNRNRLNSIDSDMVTSGEESTSLLSPPTSSNIVINENFSETAALASSDETPVFQEQLISDTLHLQQSVQRLSVGLSSACLLVEAAVGPLESTFKFPKTKKDIMNEWLSKSPERNSTYDTAHSIDYCTNPTDNNNTPHPFISNKTFSGDKSLDNLMKVTKTMIGNFSGGILSTESTPEKNYNSEQSEPENLSTFCNAIDSCSSISPNRSPAPLLLQAQKLGKKSENEIFREVPCNLSDKRGPKRYRKGIKGLIEERSCPIKRSLRSNTGVENAYEIVTAPYGNCTPPRDTTFIPAVLPEVKDTETLIAPQPPQHSAKKRWLRQAISEESDSPTAESPPNEMVTPLKKRRLARESLSLEPPFSNSDDSHFTSTGGTPKKNFDIPPQYVRTHSEGSLSCNFVSKPLCKISDNFELKVEAEKHVENESKIVTDVNQELSLVNKTDCDSSDTAISEMNGNEGSKLEKPEAKCDEVNKIDDNNDKKIQNESALLTDLKISFTNFSRIKNSNECLDSKDDACLTDIVSDKHPQDPCREIKSEPVSNVHSAETSGNSSPILDDMDDIQKKIHTFHTENIQILKIRNKKQPKEKRKKVNLNFDLCEILDNQTIGVELKAEKEISNTDDNIESKPLLAKESPSISRNVDLANSLVDESSATTVTSSSALQDSSCARNQDISSTTTLYQNHNALSVENSNKSFMYTPLFSGSFKDETNTLNAQMPDINVIKNAIDMTTSLEIGLKNSSSSVDEYKNVQEILSRVNQMDSHNSVLLSGVLRDSNHSFNTDTTVATINKTFLSRTNDPRLNPPPVEKPKPIRRKLSINEYRRRHSMASSSSSVGEQDSSVESVSSSQQNISSATSHDATAVPQILTDDTCSQSATLNECANILDSLNTLIPDKSGPSYPDIGISSTGKNLPFQCATSAVNAQITSTNVNVSLADITPQLRSTR